MLPSKTLSSVLAAVLVAAAFVVTRPGVSAAAEPVRVMPLGDSITAGPGCWRAKLWNRLRTAGHTGVDFVGGVSDGGGCNPGYAYDHDHEGHGGFSATGIADNNQLPPWLAAARPDVVLMHLGTNDMWGGWIPLATKMTALTKLVGQMRAQNPDVKIIAAQIVPMSQSACATCPADVVAFNAAIPGWAAGLSTTRSPIVVADLWTGFDAARDTGDGVHPNDAGFQKMADAWYPALAAVLGGTSASPSVSPSSSRSVSPSASRSVSASPSSGGGCVAVYQVASQWGGNFQGEVTVRNTAATASKGWTATFTFADGQRMSQSWNASYAQTGATVTARDAGYNGVLPPGGSATFGFIASWNNTTNTAPAVTCATSG